MGVINTYVNEFLIKIPSAITDTTIIKGSASLILSHAKYAALTVKGL